jgi:hypothetical protein
MYRSDVPVQPTRAVREHSIFDSVPEPVVKPKPVPEPKPVEKQIDPVKIQIKYVDKVLIFYSDRTYDEFLNTQKPEI